MTLDLELYDPQRWPKFTLESEAQTHVLFILQKNEQIENLKLVLKALSSDVKFAFILMVDGVDIDDIPDLNEITSHLNEVFVYLSDQIDLNSFISLLNLTDIYIHHTYLNEGSDLTNLTQAMAMNCQIIAWSSYFKIVEVFSEYIHFVDFSHQAELSQTILDVLQGNYKQSGRMMLINQSIAKREQPKSGQNNLGKAAHLFKEGQLNEAAQIAEKIVESDYYSLADAKSLIQILTAVDKDNIAKIVLKKALDGIHLFKGELQEVYDPTIIPFNSKQISREKAIYSEAFRRFFEYLAGTKIQGDILEFGTYRGFTARIMAEYIAEFELDLHLYLYDSFEGFPEISSEDKTCYEVSNGFWTKNALALPSNIERQIAKALKKIIPAEQLTIVKGFFEDTLPQNLPSSKASLVHIDCDLYSSTQTVLKHLLENDILQDGTLLLFDDYNCNHANLFMGERLAFREAFESQEKFTFSPYFSYGWSSHAFFVHDLAKKR